MQDTHCINRCVLTAALLGCTLFLCATSGCGLGPGEETVLVGNWVVTQSDQELPGELRLIFNAWGDISQVKLDDGGAIQTAGVLSETTLAENTITVTVPYNPGELVFEGTLADDGQSITGVLSTDLEIGNVQLTLTGATVTLTRAEAVAAD